jgi:hypothetical protein
MWLGGAHGLFPFFPFSGPVSQGWVLRHKNPAARAAGEVFVFCPNMFSQRSRWADYSEQIPALQGQILLGNKPFSHKWQAARSQPLQE